MQWSNQFKTSTDIIHLSNILKNRDLGYYRKRKVVNFIENKSKKDKNRNIY